KIFSIITLSEKLSKDYDTHVVPVFWIAGEDHDFDEVNHTYVFNEHTATLQKIKYSIMTPTESSVSKYTPDKEALHKALNEFFKELKETEASPKLLNMCRKIIDNYDGWTDMFKALLHEVFKHYGLLLIDANDKALRRIEKPMFKDIIKNHNLVDNAFRQTQAQTITDGLDQMIQIDTDEHLNIVYGSVTQILNIENRCSYLNKSEKSITEQKLPNKEATEPDKFSNKAVKTPVIEEWQFNPVAFIG